jgi:hypothetical protein
MQNSQDRVGLWSAALISKFTVTSCALESHDYCRFPLALEQEVHHPKTANADRLEVPSAADSLVGPPNLHARLPTSAVCTMVCSIRYACSASSLSLDLPQVVTLRFW